jgi:hypothetical protein
MLTRYSLWEELQKIDYLLIKKEQDEFGLEGKQMGKVNYSST